MNSMQHDKEDPGNKLHAHGEGRTKKFELGMQEKEDPETAKIEWGECQSPVAL
jgi:hypothetical protein